MLEIPGKDGFSPLHNACKAGDTWLVKLLLLKNPEKQVTVRDDSGAMPIDIACQYNHAEIAKILLKFSPQVQILHEHQMGNILFTLCTHGSYETFCIIQKI